MATSKIVGGALALLLGVSCQPQEPSAVSPNPVQELSELHCEAVTLRKARFDLADEMRFLEDTLINPNTTDSAKKALTLKLESLEPYKDSIVHRSLELSKVIKVKLDSLIEHTFTSQEQREAFDSQLTQELERRGCQ